jgi:hypothetical protein
MDRFTSFDGVEIGRIRDVSLASVGANVGILSGRNAPGYWTNDTLACDMRIAADNARLLEAFE